METMQRLGSWAGARAGRRSEMKPRAHRSGREAQFHSCAIMKRNHSCAKGERSTKDSSQNGKTIVTLIHSSHNIALSAATPPVTRHRVPPVRGVRLPFAVRASPSGLSECRLIPERLSVQ